MPLGLNHGKRQVALRHLAGRQRPGDRELRIERVQASFEARRVRFIVKIDELAIFRERLEAMRFAAKPASAMKQCYKQFRLTSLRPMIV